MAANSVRYIYNWLITDVQSRLKSRSFSLRSRLRRVSFLAQLAERIVQRVKSCLSVCVCMCVNQGGTDHDFWTWRLVILHGDPDIPRTFPCQLSVTAHGLFVGLFRWLSDRQERIGTNCMYTVSQKNVTLFIFVIT